jgi:NAD(P)-dependent dehydrogenase (short-subunit alcohol dehydrogenase family)
MNTISNKIALITGGSRGLGKSMALNLADDGFDVIITYQTQKAAADLVVQEIEEKGRKAISLPYDAADVSSLDIFYSLLKKDLKQKWNTDKLDVLINNAGIGTNIPFLKVSEVDFNRFMDIHLKSVYFLSQLLLPMINYEGRIINISSTSTQFCVSGYSIYAIMKGAVETFTRYLAVEAAPQKITVNVIAPGAVETDFNNAALRNNADRRKTIAGQTALGRIGQADDIGGLVSLICDKRSGWITGQRLDVSGGICLSLQSASVVSTIN